MQTAVIDQLVGQVVGKQSEYRVERLLGQGRLNAVYLARNLSEQRTLALTLFITPEHFSREMHSRFMQRFFAAVPALKALQHPHILSVHDYGEQSGYPYLITPYLTQGSLSDRLHVQQNFSYEEVLDFLEQMVSGLQYAHQRGLVHGTLKPSNLVFNREQQILVAGFGLMHILQMSGIERNKQPYAHLLSIAETFLAAPEYLAPEIVEGRSIDKRSDVYALGCILFELLSGAPPFKGDDPLAVAQMHVRQPLPSLRALVPDLPVALISVINQALERDPARRFQQPTELLEAFAQVVQGVTKSLPSASSKKAAPVSQDTPPTGYLSGNWQFTPPIVTGKIPAIKVDQLAPKTAEPKRQATGPISWQPEIASGSSRSFDQARPQTSETPSTRKRAQQQSSLDSVRSLPPEAPAARQRPQQSSLDSVRVSRSAQSSLNPLPNAVSRPPAALNHPPVSLNQPSISDERAQPLVRQLAPQPHREQTLQDVEPEAWWLQPQTQQQAPQQERPALRLSEYETAYGSLPLEPEPARSRPTPRKRQGARRSSSGPSRRTVLAVAATGGVVAASALITATLNPFRIGGGMQRAAGTAPANQQGQNQGNTAQQGGNAPQQPKAGGKNVVGSTTLALNTAQNFTDPKDGKQSILVHLPNGKFVAYKKACTHEGVNVNYDPGTHTLVCPAHNAIFDPAAKAAVVQGPATTPLAAVAVKVNADGTVTTL